MQEITFTIPVTEQSIAFIKQALQSATIEGFDTTEYLKQIEAAELGYEIARKQTELEDLQNMLGELTNGS
jgi:hypothetical protein